MAGKRRIHVPYCGATLDDVNYDSTGMDGGAGGPPARVNF